MPFGSCALLVIQSNRSKIATREGRVPHSKFLMNQWRNELSSRGRLGHHPAFTKNVQEPNVGSRSLIFAQSVGSKPPLFASPSDLVCGPLHLPVFIAFSFNHKPCTASTLQGLWLNTAADTIGSCLPCRRPLTHALRCAQARRRDCQRPRPAHSVRCCRAPLRTIGFQGSAHW
jgi:hypothetical protein